MKLAVVPEPRPVQTQAALPLAMVLQCGGRKNGIAPGCEAFTHVSWKAFRDFDTLQRTLDLVGWGVAIGQTADAKFALLDPACPECTAKLVARFKASQQIP